MQHVGPSRSHGFGQLARRPAGQPVHDTQTAADAGPRGWRFILGRAQRDELGRAQRSLIAVILLRNLADPIVVRMGRPTDPPLLADASSGTEDVQGLTLL